MQSIEQANSHHPTIKFLQHKRLQRRKICKRVYTGRKNAFQTYWNISVHTFLLLVTTHRG